MRERPASVAEAAETLAGCARAGRTVRILGGRTKSDWGELGEPEVELETSALKGILEHNRGDFTAVLEAGLPLRDAQASFAEAGQMLAWDPPLGLAGDDASAQGGATVGGIVASADSGPSRHRYGGVRDTLIGLTVILSDGTVARAGGKVIKNVAGYDLGKLFTGSLGTLGMIATVSVRLHPLARNTETVVGCSEEPERVAATAAALARRPLEADCLDVSWEGDRGLVLVRFAGAAAERRAEEATRNLGLERMGILDEDPPVWEHERSLQRSGEGTVLKVSARPSDLSLVLGAARAQRATVVSRAALGVSWVAFAPDGQLAERVAAFTAAVSPRLCRPLDGASRAGAPQPPIAAGPLAVMRRLKERLDPAGCLPTGPIGS
jgi:glycolate oxidase FAD binding subunit